MERNRQAALDRRGLFLGLAILILVAVGCGQTAPGRDGDSRDISLGTPSSRPQPPGDDGLQYFLGEEKPKHARSVARTTGVRPADFEQHIERLKEKLPGEGFTIVVERPFVVIGDEPADNVRARSRGTVKWAVEHLKKLYFEKEPSQIIDIWLFKDEESYTNHAKHLFGDVPSTPYGYYSPSQRALVMNIATGGGTLVHEIVHPFVAANFPTCPSWFNEGLASLYEQCGEEGGTIKGYPNWRLTGLQRAIKSDRVPTFEELCATTRDEFYGDHQGTNYGQARYLCYYLQEHGLLTKYYHAFRTSARTDPTGYKTLQTVLGESDMAAFQKKWEAYVAKLRRT